MKMRIKKLILDNFKGVKHKEYNMDSLLVRIFGMNGVGKTTIATAWYWLTVDKDYELKSNPDIRPLGVEECIPTVTAILDIDGKEVIITKMQKKRTSKPDEDGVSKITLTNAYEINSVPKTERDFKAYLGEKGLQFVNFLACSHPDVFTGQKQDDMRTVLFKMSSEKSDYGIAGISDKTADVAKLLESYTIQEIEAMNKASKKKAGEEVDSIPSQIIGKESSKVDIDVAELELAKSALNEQISELDAKINNASKVIDDLGQKELRLKFDINALAEDANRSLLKERSELTSKIADCEYLINKAKSELDRSHDKIKSQKELIASYGKRRAELTAEWKKENSTAFDDKPYLFNEEVWRFDESDTVCSQCGQTLPTGEIEQRRAEFERRKDAARQTMDSLRKSANKEFEENKKQQMASIEKMGSKCKSDITKAEEEIKGLEAVNALLENELKEHESELASHNEKLAALPEKIDISTNPVYIDLTARLSKIQKEIAQLRDSDSVTDGFREEKVKLQAELQAIHEKLGQASNNIRIDEQISELIEKKRDYEQKKADAERILYQLDEVKKLKNKLLVDGINEHFSIVKWKLFDYAQNGNYKEVCVPYAVENGVEKEFTDDMNTGLKIRAKLDICNSFQKFFGMSVPVFADGMESMNDFNIPEMDCQLITLSVSDDKGLIVRNE